MAALDFPDAPTNGQVYDKWTWNGTQWVLTAGPGTPGMDAAWTTYTPAVGNYPLGASATVTGRYLRFGPTGKTVMVYTFMNILAAYAGTGAITFGPPFPLRGANSYDKAITGHGLLNKLSAGSTHMIFPYANGANVSLTYIQTGAASVQPSPAGLIDNAGALKLAVNDYMFFTYTAELA